MMGFFDETSLERQQWEIEAALILAVKLTLYESTKVCMWCDCDLKFEKATLEHLTPRSHGGETSVANGGLACASCNKKRGVLTSEEFMLTKWLINKRRQIASERRNGTHGKARKCLDGKSNFL